MSAVILRKLSIMYELPFDFAELMGGTMNLLGEPLDGMKCCAAGAAHSAAIWRHPSALVYATGKKRRDQRR
eukprot:5798473-Heterocapsa_arctica.AAC.1